MLSTTFGVTVFLVMLLAAAHILLNLWTLSTLEAVAYDAASDVAVALGDGGDRAALEHQARERALAALGSYGDRVDFTFETVDADSVAVVASGPSLSVMPKAFASAVGLDRLERRVVVRTEGQP